MLNPTEIEERLRLKGLEWAELDEAANLLEELKNSVLADYVNKADGSSVAARETAAKANPEYKDYIKTMVQARGKAIRAKVEYDSARAWVELVRTSEATKRAELRG